MKDIISECVVQQAELVKHTKSHNFESHEVSSVKVCLQLFGTAYLFADIEYRAEQVSVSESIAEIFPSDT